MTKVLLVTNQDWGHYVHRMPLARALRAANGEAVFVAAPGPYASFLENEGFRFIPWNVDRRSMNPFREIAPLIDLARIYRRERPDAIIQFTIKPILYGSVAARLTGVPAIVNEFTGVGFPFLQSGPSHRYRPVLGPLLRQLLKRDNTFTIFHNEEDRSALIKQGVLEPSRSLTIFSSGVNTDRFAPRSSGAPGHIPVVLMAARLLWDKGIADYVAAARQVRAQGVPARFLVAGAADPGSTVAINDAQIAQWKAEGTVEFLGHRDDMPELLGQADIAVLSSHHEGLPRFLLEAAASGLPIVATDVSGCRVVVRNGVNGTLVPSEEPPALASALVPLLNDTEMRERFGKNSRDIALREFSEVQAMREHLSVLAKLGVRF